MLANKSVVPELVQKDAQPQKISREALAILNDATKIEYIKNELKILKEKLGTKSVVNRVAKEIIDILTHS